MSDSNPQWGTPEWHRAHPVYGTDFNKPPETLIADVRSQLVRARGQLFDLGYGYPYLRDRVECVEGLLTCGLITLYGVIEEIKNLKDMREQAIEASREQK